MTDIKLKPFLKDDFESFYELISDPSIKEAGIPENLNKEQLSFFFENNLYDKWHKKITYKNLFVGIIFLNERGQSPDLINTRELGFAVNKKFRRKGIATKSVELACVGAKKIGIKEIWASTYVDNDNSKSVLLKNGFIYKYQADMSILGLKNQNYYMKILN